tara:strand:- start:658 stop:813 length:156 start_codon:yes stop_codon:yes gene_type:complete
MNTGTFFAEQVANNDSIHPGMSYVPCNGNVIITQSFSDISPGLSKYTGFAE